MNILTYLKLTNKEEEKRNSSISKDKKSQDTELNLSIESAE